MIFDVLIILILVTFFIRFDMMRKRIKRLEEEIEGNTRNIMKLSNNILDLANTYNRVIDSLFPRPYLSDLPEKVKKNAKKGKYDPTKRGTVAEYKADYNLHYVCDDCGSWLDKRSNLDEPYFETEPCSCGGTMFLSKKTEILKAEAKK